MNKTDAIAEINNHIEGYEKAIEKLNEKKLLLESLEVKTI